MGRGGNPREILLGPNKLVKEKVRPAKKIKKMIFPDLQVPASTGRMTVVQNGMPVQLGDWIGNDYVAWRDETDYFENQLDGLTYEFNFSSFRNLSDLNKPFASHESIGDPEVYKTQQLSASERCRFNSRWISKDLWVYNEDVELIQSFFGNTNHTWVVDNSIKESNRVFIYYNYAEDKIDAILQPRMP